MRTSDDSIMQKESATKEESFRETGRVEAFSDGVFAIAITLLVLEIKVPHGGEMHSADDLVKALVQIWPSFFAYILSFVFVLIGWINHHRLFTHIKRIDGAFLYLNGFLLLMFTFQPFPTALLAEHIGRPAEKVAAVVYAFIVLLIAIGYQLLWRYASHNHRLLKANVDAAKVRQITHEYNKTFPVFVVAFAVSFYNVAASLGLITALMLFYAVTGFTSTDATA